MRKFARSWLQAGAFVRSIESIEGLVNRGLAVALVLVTLGATLNLGIVLVSELIKPPFGSLSVKAIEVFGLILDILIAMELLNNTIARLKTRTIRVELVLATAAIAVSRKLIVLDLSKTTGTQLLGLAAAILSLAVSYIAIRYTRQDISEDPHDS
ncbi:MAG: phosphate-starvation-inducible PsiE family protein [Cyanobacteria bacterium J06648_11]